MARAWWKGEGQWCVSLVACWLKIDGPPERPVLLGAYHHAVAPSDGRAQGDLLQNAESDISV